MDDLLLPVAPAKGVLLSVRSSKVEVEAQGARLSSGDIGETGEIIVLRLSEISEGGRVEYVLFAFVWFGYVLWVGAGCAF
jgi:hypothetical protein